VDPVLNSEIEKSPSEVESVAESLSNVAISITLQNQMDKGSHTKPKAHTKASKKWTRKKPSKQGKAKEILVADLRKRQLVDVIISEGEPMDLCGVEQKRRLNSEATILQSPEGVLDDQHLLPQ
jgi:Asp-tRNA(Asn)/Glu-tRNA(Gln) amidotransferase C subunit